MLIKILTPEELEAIVKNAVVKALEAFPAHQSQPATKYITKDDAARLCGCSVKTIEARIKCGLYRSIKDGNARASRVRVLAEDVRQSLKNPIVRPTIAT